MYNMHTYPISCIVPIECTAVGEYIFCCAINNCLLIPVVFPTAHFSRVEVISIYYVFVTQKTAAAFLHDFHIDGFLPLKSDATSLFIGYFNFKHRIRLFFYT